jgi:hypothetical protein
MTMKQPQAIYDERTYGVNILLMCGVFSVALYLSMNIFIPLLYPGYDVASQTVSELSAIDTPTRRLWAVLGAVYGILVVFFGKGIYNAAYNNKKLKIAGVMIIIYAIVGLFWPPMHRREVLAAGGASLTDTLHIVFTFITIPLMLASTILAGLCFGKQFMIYSFITVVTQIVFGILTGLDAPAMESGQPTPFIGIWERISIGVYIIWQIALVWKLFQRVNTAASSTRVNITIKPKQRYTQGAD